MLSPARTSLVGWYDYAEVFNAACAAPLTARLESLAIRTYCKNIVHYETHYGYHCV